MRKLVAIGLLMATGLAVFAIATSGMTRVSADRSASAALAGDGTALVTLSGFAWDQYPLTLNDGYRQAGQLLNRAGQSAQVSLQVDPDILVACRLWLGNTCILNANWTLRLCWSYDMAPQGTNNCTAPRRLLTFNGNGPGNPGPASTVTIPIPAGGSGYLFVRVTGNGPRFCARATMAWTGTYGAGAGAFNVYHSNAAPRAQIYRVGGATC